MQNAGTFDQIREITPAEEDLYTIGRLADYTAEYVCQACGERDNIDTAYCSACGGLMELSADDQGEEGE
jgi:hypothetical protein